MYRENFQLNLTFFIHETTWRGSVGGDEAIGSA